MSRKPTTGRLATRFLRGLVGCALLAFTVQGCGGGPGYKVSTLPDTGSARRGDSRTATGKPLPTPAVQVPGQTLPSAPHAAIKVALLLPLTGPQEDIGGAMQKAAELALFDVADKNFTLIPIDTKGTPDGATLAASRAIREGASLILGPLLSGSVTAMRHMAGNAGINIVTFSTDPTVAGSGVYVMGFLARPQVRRIVSYAISQGVRRFAALAPTGAHGEAVVAEFRRVAQEGGAVVTEVAYYNPADADVSPVVRAFARYSARRARSTSHRGRKKRRRRRAAPPPVDYEAVLLPAGGNELVMLAALLSFYDIDSDQIHYLGTGQWDDPAVSREPTLRGGWFAAPPPAGRQKFEARYAESYGGPPPRIASLAYDAVALAAVLARHQGGPDFGRAALESQNGFVGIDGIFRFAPDGLVDRGLAVLEVHAKEFRMISPSPDSFAQPQG